MAPSDMSEMSEALRAALAPIRQNFVASVPERVAIITSSLDAIAAGSDLDSALFNLRSEIHKIAGIAGSIGFQNLGDLSAETDTALRALISGDDAAPDIDDILNHIDLILMKLASIAAKSGG